MKRNIFLTLLGLLLIPGIVFAQVIFPNRGGTGTSDAPASDQLLVGNGSTYDLKTLTAGSNVTIDTTGGAVTISAALSGGGVATADIDTYAELNAIVADVTLTHNGLFDTEAELEAILSDVSDLFTSNDTIDISDYTNLTAGTGITLTGDTLSVDLGTSIDTSEITNGTIIEPDLSADVVAADGDFLQYDSTGTNFTWRSASELVSDIGLGNVENTALSTWAGSSNITTLGSINTGVWQGTAITDTYVSDTLTIGSGSSVADGALSANVSLLGSTISVGELASADFGDFTCNGVTCSLDTSYQPLDAGLTSIAGLTTAADRMIYTTAADTYAVTTLSSFGRSLIDDAAASNARTTLGLGSLATLSTINNGNWSGTDLSVANGGTGASTFTTGGVLFGNGTSAFTNSGVLTNGQLLIGDGSGAPTVAALTAGTGIGVSNGAGSITLSADLGTAIDTSEITDDTITHADIADADQATTICFGVIENPTADDDFVFWHNGTTNDLELTAIWGKSDQTVSFDLQVDDGSPADVNGTDIVPAAGEAEDTSLSGDTTVAAGEEILLAITSVTNSPTWFLPCATGNWVD